MTTLAANVKKIQSVKVTYVITASNVPQNSRSTTAQPDCTSTAFTGVRCFGCTAARRRKNTPSSAMAK